MQQNGYRVSIRKTTKINVDENNYQLPPDLGAFNEFKVADYFCPDNWDKNGIFIPVTEREPLWIDLRHNPTSACLVSVQKVNPITGEKSDLKAGLSKDPKQNYLKLPEQLWLDGYSKDGKVYQFTVTTEKSEYAVCNYVLDPQDNDSQAIGIAFFGEKNPKPKPVIKPNFNDCFSTPYNKKYKKCNSPIPLIAQDDTIGYNGISYNGINYNSAGERYLRGVMEISCMGKAAPAAAIVESFSADFETTTDFNCDVQIKASMAAGGRILQNIRQDDNSIDFYKSEPDCIISIYMCLPEQFQQIMKKGRRDEPRKDKYIMSGEIAGKQIPLMP
jgi:hypothetical protein